MPSSPSRVASLGPSPFSVDTGAKQKYLTLPATAVTYNPFGETVFVVKQGEPKDGKPTIVAQQAFVTSGPTRGDQVAIVKGLEEGTEVVTSGQLKLKNGTAVKTLLGQSIKVKNTHGVHVNNAKVVTADIECTNGVIHAIDHVLLPK